jgi:redox-sensitive bicupin YhaK (pirin superfamily)
MERKIKKKVTGFQTQDGAGVKLVRVLGHQTVEDYDPILMLDSFDSRNPKDYIAGFPMHPHRGIETISYVYKGQMMHKDSLGNSDTVGDGGVQWMTAGSGILHEERLPESERLLGVQLWLNMPGDRKMTPPGELQ